MTFCRGSRLMAAAAIITVIGLALAVGASLDLPPSWNTAIVGLSLFAAGALRRLITRDRGAAPRGSERGTA